MTFTNDTSILTPVEKMITASRESAVNYGADSIGFNRTITGSDAVGQHYKRFADEFNSFETCSTCAVKV